MNLYDPKKRVEADTSIPIKSFTSATSHIWFLQHMLLHHYYSILLDIGANYLWSQASKTGLKTEPENAK